MKRTSQADKTALFETMPVPKAVLTLAVPTVASILVTLLYSLADTWFVGLLNDPIQNAAVTIIAPVLLAFNAVNNLFGTGCSSMMSRALGRKDTETAQRCASFGFWCSLLCGIFLMTAALSGISGWQLSDFAQELSKMQVAAEQARTGVEIRNREALCAIIKSKTEAYIWDKAQELDLSVSIEVMVEADGSYPYPSGVQITGAFTPQQRKTLEAYIEENLAIGKERQIWTNE